MKSSRWPTFVQSGLLLFVLLGLGYWAWKRYHRPPSEPAYEGETLARWVTDLGNPNYKKSEHAADVLVRTGAAAVPVLLEARATDDIRLHRRVSAVLIRIGESAAPGLIDALKEKPNEQRIVVPLVRMGPAAVPALIAALNDDKASRQAAAVLGLIGPRAADAVPALIEIVKDRHTDASLRGAAAIALGAIGTPNADILTALLAALKDDKAEVRQHAAEALAWIGSPAREATPALSAASNDDADAVAAAACRALAHIGANGAIQPLFAALRSKRDAVGNAAIVALWQMGPAAKDVTPALVALLDDPPPRNERSRAVLLMLGPVAVPALTAALKNEKPTVRRTAAQLLGAIGSPARPSVAALANALRDETPAVRLAAAVALTRIDATRADAAIPLLADAVDSVEALQALADIGSAARAAVPALIAALKHDDKDIRQGARRALTSIGTPAVSALLDARKDKDAGVSDIAAAVALARIEPKRTGEVVPVLIQELDSKDRKRLIAAIEGLGLLGAVSESAVPLLIERLKEPDLVEPILSALRRIGPPAWKAAPALLSVLRQLGEQAAVLVKQVLTALGPKAIPAIVPLLQDDDVRFRRFAVSVLAEYGPSAKPALSALHTALHDKDPAVRAGAAGVVESIGSEATDAVDDLIEGLQTYQTEVRLASALALGHLGRAAEDARRPLRECLLDPDAKVRYAAALSLGRIDAKYTEAISDLRNALYDCQPWPRLGAIDALLRIDKTRLDETTPILAELSGKPYDLAVRFRATQGLLQFAPKQAKTLAPWLDIELTGTDADARLQAATLLTRIEPKQTRRAVLAVLPALWSADAGVRLRVVRALGSIGPKAREGVSTIVRLLQDDEPEVRAEAAKALRRITD